MARITGIFGTISGKVGDKVYYTRNGKNFVKSLPAPSGKPASEKQLAQRQKFKIVMGFLSSISGLINHSYHLINPKKTGLKVFSNDILAKGIKGKYPDFKINYPEVRLLRGSLVRPECPFARMKGSDQLYFKWFNRHLYSSPADELVIMIYCEALSRFFHSVDPGIKRSDACGVIPLPSAFAGLKVYVWLAFRSPAQRSYSDSVYAGVIYPRKKSEGHENSK